MLAMDVVDTLRHEQLMVEKDLASEDRQQFLINRLRDIYSAQGIDVPDSVLMEGVMALEDERFVYAPPRPSFSTKLAKLYINRRKWMPLLYTLVFIIGSVFAINYVGFVRPAQLEAKQTEKLLTKTLPESLAQSHEKALNLAATSELKDRANRLYKDGMIAIDNKDVKGAQNATDDLSILANDLSQDYTLRIVSRPGEMSGVFRLNDDGPNEVKNYYLIVEGITASGNTSEVLVISEEDQKTRRVTQWGIRVPAEVFNRMADDKRDDQIIQNSTIGHKKQGYLTPDYTIETSGGLILDW